MIKKIGLILLACSALAILSACNTVHGLGEDVQDAGEHISHSAN